MDSILFWLLVAIAAILGGLALLTLLAFLVVRWLSRRGLYRVFFLLRHRRKLVFLWLLLTDRRVPLYVKLLPLLAVAYWASPIDLIPWVFLDDLAVSLLALALVMRLTPQEVVLDLLRQAEDSHAPSAPVEASGRERQGRP